MAITANAQWWVRQSGNVLNGGGWDDSISGAGTNYCDQDSPQLSLSDLATSGAGVTTLTSATGGFTAAMVGNAIRIASGTNFQAGYYFVTGYTNTNTVTLDRTPSSGGAGSGGVGRLGGACASIIASFSGSASPLANPTIAENRVWIRGSGSRYPTSADYTHTGYHSFVGGVRFCGYNGRPRIHTAGMLAYSSRVHWASIYAHCTTGDYGGFGVFHDSLSLVDCYLDQNGYDITGTSFSLLVADCQFINSGSTTAGTNAAVIGGSYAGIYLRNMIQAWRGGGIYHPALAGGMTAENLVIGTRGVGINVLTNEDGFRAVIVRNTVMNNASDGIKLSDVRALRVTQVEDNIVVGNGGYGINYSGLTSAVVARERRSCARNVFWGNTSGTYNGLSLDATDRVRNPGLVANVWRPAYSPVRVAIGGNPSIVTVYDSGAIQREETQGIRTRPLKGTLK